uniref:Uncharacterized protein n=1 Tax=Schizopora paradoxa TaxID=27342 RepID=A0A5B9RKF0_9AGAM|nr:hypothetical protein Schpa_000046 [Schizopora paradoxa]QEG57215.1 hypothetical protein Schpa_000046 [Schizopora paradoxa]
MNKQMNNKLTNDLIQLVTGVPVCAGYQSWFRTNTQILTLEPRTESQSTESHVLSPIVDSSKEIGYQVSESHVLSPIVDIFNYTQEILSGLTLEQHACFVNGLGFFLVFITLNSLVSAYFGNKIIQYFQLDKKYPRLAKIIEYRIKFMNFYLISNTIFLYALSLFFIMVNLFFFFN